MYTEDELVPLSALQHWVFCPRQCGLIHLEGQWGENRFTAQGRLLHEKAHQAGAERQGQVRIERGLALRSLSLGLTGKADVVEFHPFEGGWRPFPVEYKRGRPKSHDADRVQVCAQAMCLEEMLEVEIPTGALFYGDSRRREEVVFEPDLRSLVIRTAGEVHDMLDSGLTPPPRAGPLCKSCSMRPSCLPDRTKSPQASSRYLTRELRRAQEDS